LIGKAQEKARVVRTERRQNAQTGQSYAWLVSSTAMVNHYYFYCVDDDFGPFFLNWTVSGSRPGVWRFSRMFSLLFEA
jgi:hypothetical protein